jgi:hypothetical protein
MAHSLTGIFKYRNGFRISSIANDIWMALVEDTNSVTTTIIKNIFNVTYKE